MSTEAHPIVAVPYVLEIVAFLVTVVVLVPMMKRIKVSPVLGYLAVGAIIGPYALGWVSDVAGVQHVAELGVIFLLFTIGLELSFERLRAYSKLIFGFGSLQVGLTAIVIAVAAWTWGNSVQVAIIIGLCLALSSTAMVMQLLAERGENATVHGRTSFAALLFQDLAVVPILILLGVFGGDSGDSLWVNVGLALGKAVLVVAVIVIIGRYVLRYLFRVASATRSVDVFTAMILLAVLATSVATGMAGLSMALGAFLAGLLLAETEFRHQIESEIEPFKGLLLGLFFMGVGMNIDFVMAFDKGIWVLLSVLGLLGIKAVIASCIARLFLPTWGASMRTGLILAEAGEFAFVVIGQATLTYSLMPADVGQFMVVVAGISMALTPVLAWLGQKVEEGLQTQEPALEVAQEDADRIHGHVVILGFGRVGQSVASVLASQGIPYIAFDANTQLVKAMRLKGEPVFFGDGSKVDVLERAGIAVASALLITTGDVTTSETMVKRVHAQWPALSILVRARDAVHSHNLIASGATSVVPEALEASLQLSGHVLCALGLPREEANACMEVIRRNNYDALPKSKMSL
ncbi:monovalent cation:proton antiporter-2 (CPA2) family protein [Marinagarivorans algicola]|uniref:monovalent cation:proton antiporter-2 (CPA2) family protein n=1 Tax=Marinagarivorans algicola TaxID=1513270 RepID=UPI0006B97C4B|nr:monovalent cation:proton antiporter-2 (CPA2) family protein [Marinagarivorans algicola]